eukprot:COSAG02_NODE_1996_length_10156_cov_5.319081_8_plen_59_part_00
MMEAVAEMGRRRLEHQLQAAQHMLEAQRQEMEELKKLKKEWQRTGAGKQGVLTRARCR